MWTAILSSYECYWASFWCYPTIWDLVHWTGRADLSWTSLGPACIEPALVVRLCSMMLQCLILTALDWGSNKEEKGCSLAKTAKPSLPRLAFKVQTLDLTDSEGHQVTQLRWVWLGTQPYPVKLVQLGQLRNELWNWGLKIATLAGQVECCPNNAGEWIA